MRDLIAPKWVVTCSSILLTSVVLLPLAGHAAENGAGVYALGSKGPGAGLTPPPGVYFQNDFYIYDGKAGSSISIPENGEIATGIHAQMLLDVPAVLWVTSAKIFGGNLGFVAAVPVGGQDIEASIGGFSKHDSLTTFGDPVLGSIVGWTSGNFHWQSGVLVNVPIGDYQHDGLANLAAHRWAVDVSGAATWLDPTTGIDLSSTIGFTFNGENPATDYRTGTEFHWEGAVSRSFTKQFSAGITGYYYQQITGDSGAGAVLGDFEGRTAAIGATAAYTFIAGSVPVTWRVKYFHEFDVDKRLEADAGYVTVAFPIAMAGQ